MTAELVIPVVGASLLGSLHCAFMCGGLVSAMGVGTGTCRVTWGRQFSFHLGRLAVYVSLGAAFGAMGSAIDLVGRQAGVIRGAAFLAGALVVVGGLAGLLSSQGVRLPTWSVPATAQRWMVARLSGGRRGARTQALLLGACTALLPCGWLYAFVLSAAGTGSLMAGALLMAAFWLGTVPALLGLGVFVQRLSGPLRRHVPVLGAALLVLVGLFTILHRVNIPAEALPRMVGSIPVGAAEPKEGMPCH
jgi:uncharacterized protein